MYAERQSFAQIPAIVPDFPMLDDEFDYMGMDDGFDDSGFQKQPTYYSRRIF